MLKFNKDDILRLAKAVPPSSELLLVHDQGVYVMCMNQPVGSRTIIYAEGCDPNSDADWWQTSRTLAVGDDFGEPVASAAEIIAILKHAARGLEVQVTPSRIITTVY